MSKPTTKVIAKAGNIIKESIAQAICECYNLQGSEDGITVEWHEEELYLTDHRSDMVFRIELEFHTTLD